MKPTSRPTPTHHITRYLLGDIKSPNPIMADTMEEARVGSLYNFSLFNFDWRLEPFADSDSTIRWQSSKDRLYDKVTMRRDCTWSDGKPITAHDVEFSYHAIMNDKIPVPAVKSGTDKLKGVVAYDDYTVVYFHKESLATNEWNVNFPVIPEHIFAPLYKKLDTMSFEELLQTPEYQETELKPVSGNAYTMTSRTRNQEIVLKRRDDWYTVDGKQVREKPYFDEVEFPHHPRSQHRALGVEIRPHRRIRNPPGAMGHPNRRRRLLRQKHQSLRRRMDLLLLRLEQ